MMEDTALRFILYAKIIVYICAGSDLSNFPPVITSEFELEYFLPISNSLNLRCQAENGQITYEWYKNYMKVKDNQRVTFDLYTGEIFFRNVTKDDFGTYYCLARNEFGASVSSFFKISEAFLDSFSDLKDINHECLEYRHCKLSCQNKPRCEPKNDCKEEWKIGDGTSTNVKLNGNVTLDSKGDLHFLNIKRFDAKNEFGCCVWNEKLNTLKKGSITKILLNTTDSTEEYVPAQPVFQNGDKVFISKTAILQCIFSGNPVPEVNWRNQNGSLIETNYKYVIKDYGRELHIQNVTFEDEGVYRCIAENNLTQYPYLNITAPPIFPDVAKRFMIKIINPSIDEEVELLCNAKSAEDEFEPAVVKWMKNGHIINQDSAYQLSKDERTLRIASLHKGGCYTCVIENSEGIAVANFLLHEAQVDLHHVDGNLTIVLVSVFCTTAGVLVAALIIRKRNHKKNTEKDITTPIQREMNSHRYSYSDASVNPYTESNTEHQEYTYVENMNNISVDSEIPVQPDVVAENNYNVLRECHKMQPDSSNPNFYDCPENVHGIYNTSLRERTETANDESYDSWKIESAYV